MPSRLEAVACQAGGQPCSVGVASLLERQGVDRGENGGRKLRIAFSSEGTFAILPWRACEGSGLWDKVMQPRLEDVEEACPCLQTPW